MQLNVVAFYEDLQTGEWAKEVFDRIRHRAPREVNARPSLWRFDVLEDGHLQALATADAANATVIIVAARGTRPLPKALLDCVEKGLMNPVSARVGLVAVLDQTDGVAKDTLPAYRQLQAVSRKAKLRFFSMPYGGEAAAVRRAEEEGFDSTPRGILDDSLSIELSYRAWGINE